MILTKKSICVVLTTRGNYAKLKIIMNSIKSHPSLELKLVIGGALLDGDYGSFEKNICNDGFHVDGKIDYIAGSKTLEDIARSSSKCTLLFSKQLQRLKPSLVIIVADRYESLSIALAALCMNVHIAHIEGGEISGSIDERIRHAITKLAHIHFPANKDAYSRLIKLGEKPETVHIVGATSLDQIRQFKLNNLDLLKDLIGRDSFDKYLKGYIVVSQHPVVTEFSKTKSQITELVFAVKDLNLPVVWVLPNDDGGASVILETLNNSFIGYKYPIIKVGALEFEKYAVLLWNCKCLIGNTSSGIRESSFMGVPVVNIGSRQNNRQQGKNVKNVDARKEQILSAAISQINNGRYESEYLYGDGNSAKKIADILAQDYPLLNKTLQF
jgi:UDP-hydrolysing UDP-N-acetyl-D-glucosamine 2-epimerase